MKRLAASMAITVLGALLGAASAGAVGFKNLDVTYTGPDGSPQMQAGSHFFATTTSFDVLRKVLEDGKELPDEEFKDLEVDLPPGLVGTPNPVPRCSTADFLLIDGEHIFSNCPDSSAIGVAQVAAGTGPIDPGGEADLEPSPVFNLAPAPGQAAKLGFIALNGVPVTVEAGLNPHPPYNLQAHVTNIPQAVQFYGSKLTLWGVPADPAHDSERGQCLVNLSKSACPVALPEIPFFTMPRSCTGPLRTSFAVRSWQNPGTWVFDESLSHDNAVPPNPLGTTGCSKLGFAPEISSQPTNTSAESPTGLEFSIRFKDEGLTNPDGIAEADIRKAVVTLPEGMTANPSLAEDLKTCSEADLARETVTSEPGEGCPQASKIGTVEVETPLLEGALLRGQVFLATQNENPFNSLLALYIVIKEPKLGIIVKLAGKVEPDPATGQLVSTFGETPGFELPQVPFSEFRFRFREGGRSPLVTPPSCGSYDVAAELTPTSGAPPLTTTSTFQITSGGNGGPCPSGTPPFEPGFEAGTLSNDAGAHSPTVMRLTRRDGDQDLTRFAAKLPPGLLAKLAGTTQCPEAALAQAKGRSAPGQGRAELASPSCPAASEIGNLLAGAGVGAELTYVPGKVYLAGPYNGAPLSVAAIVPAVAGPFDVGVVLTRIALRIDPRSALVTVDGAASDPIPHILAGIPLKVRDIRAMVDKPQFTLNPTSCEPSFFTATLWGGGSDVFSSADDSPSTRDSRFQAADCASLGFKPRLALKLKGGTKRGGHPALTGTYRPRPGDANLSGLVLRLPRSAFLDQAHIRTICTRVQFAAKACPPGAVYGQATAWTPLLDQPLSGPVYLRSSDNNLPDFVAALSGLIDVEAVARIDSVRGGIRATFTEVPDAPLSKVVVRMQGARKGLIVNSRNLCSARARANAEFAGHNGRRHRARPVVGASCGEGKGIAKRGHRG